MYYEHAPPLMDTNDNLVTYSLNSPEALNSRDGLSPGYLYIDNVYICIYVLYIYIYRFTL
jgi:hypothetical protein